MHPLEQYLTDVRLVYASGAGTPETSYHNVLGNLLNEVVGKIEPSVHAVMQIQSRGAGMEGGGSCEIRHYSIGGYQVIKKWLSYRESKLLGRSMRLDEAREVQFIARRIAALLLLEPELHANYQAVKAAVYPWHQDSEMERTTL